MPHILEMDIQRGISLWFDGKEPDNRWSYGGLELDKHDTNRVVTRGLTVDGMHISEIAFQGIHEGLPAVGQDASMRIDGEYHQGKIIAWASGPQSEGLTPDVPTAPTQIANALDDADEFDSEGETQVTLVNGEIIGIDETHLYVKIAF